MLRKYCSECDTAQSPDMIECPTCHFDLLLAPGSTIEEKYTIKKLLARGGMSQVYLARQDSLKRDLAMKIAQPPSGGIPEFKKALVNEAFVAASLVHPNIVSVFDYGETDYGHLFLAMEYLHGHSLADTLAREGPMDYVRALRIAAQVCDAVALVHEKGLVHRDLKPGNVFMAVTTGKRDFPKLLDFGLTTARRRFLEKLGFYRSRAGTPMYMSPEQLRGGVVDGRSDLFAVGAIAYEMIAGRPVFQGSESVEERERFVVPPLSIVKPNCTIPRGLDDLLLRLLASDPDHRPDDAAEVSSRFRGMLPTRPKDSRPGMKATDPPLAALDEGSPAVRLTLHEPEFVGRRKEMSRIEDILKAASDGTGVVHWYVGAEGTGKSRLGGTFLQMAAERGFTAIGSPGGGRGAIMGVWRTVVSEILGLKGPATRGQVRLKLEATEVPMDEADLLDGIGDLLYPSRAAFEWLRSDSEAYEAYICGAAERLLWHMANRRKLALFLDDFHDADGMSGNFLLRLCDLMSAMPFPMAMLVASKPLTGTSTGQEQLRRVQAALKATGSVGAISGLTESDVSALVASMWRIRCTDQVLSLATKAAAGNPMFAVEMVRHLSMSNVLTYSRGLLRLRPDAQVEVPRALLDALIGRFEALRHVEPDGAAAADLLVRIALLGGYATVSTMSSLLAAEKRQDLRDSQDRLLDLLVSQGFVNRIGQGADDLVVPSHPMMREAVTGGARDSGWARLSLLVAQLLERTFSDDLGAAAREIGEHYVDAGYLDKATDFLLMAGEDAMEQGRPGPARELYLKAENCLNRMRLKRDPRMNRVLLALAELYTWEGRFQEAETRLDAIHGDSFGPADSPENLRTMDLKVRVAEAQRKADVALKMLDGMHREFKRRGDRHRAAIALIEMACVKMNLGNNAGAEKCIFEADQLVDPDGDTKTKGLVHLAYGRLLRKAGSSDESLNHLSQAHDLLDGPRDFAEKAEALYFEGAVQWEAGRVEEALKVFDRGVSLCESVGFVRGLAAHLANRGGVLLNMERFDEGQEAIVRAMTLRERMGDPNGVGQCLTALADLAIRRRDWTNAVELARKAIAAYRKGGYVLGERIDEYNMALAYLGAGDKARAEARLKACIETTNRDNAVTLTLAKAHEKLMEIAMDGNDGAAAETHRNAAIAIYNDLGMKDQAEMLKMPATQP